METKNHGGKRPGAGRKQGEKPPYRSITAHVPAEIADYIERQRPVELSRSAWLRIIIEEWVERERKPAKEPLSALVQADGVE